MCLLVYRAKLLRSMSITQPSINSFHDPGSHLPTMFEEQSTLPPTSGAEMEPVQANNASYTPSSSVDMLALGFGVLTLDSGENEAKPKEVGVGLGVCVRSKYLDFVGLPKVL